MEDIDIVHLVAKIKVKPERLNELLKAIETILPTVRNEPGCIKYDLHRDRNDVTQLVMLETWKDRPALDAHVAAASFQKLKPLLDDSLVEPMSLLFLEKIA